MRTFPILVDLGFVVSAAALMLLLGRPLRLPSILSYMLAGLVLGPATGLLGSAQDSVALFSELGIALLLFLVGLELSVARMRDMSGLALGAGLAQVGVTIVAGALLAALLGFGREDALVLGLALTFSSTVVVVKLLERIGGVDSAHGRLAIGILLVQDVVVAVVLTLLGGLGSEGATGTAALMAGIGRAALGLMALGAVAWAAARWILPGLLGRIASSSDTLFIVTLTWCFLFLLGAEWLHASLELGAFAAGLAVAPLPYAHELARRVRPLADFFLAVFFVSLGAGMDFAAALRLWPAALALSAFVLVFKPTLVAGLLLRRGQPRPVAALSGLTLGQMSEFGFILVALAVASGLTANPDLPALVALVGLITIGASSVIVPLAPGLLRRLDADQAPVAARPSGHIVVVGMNTLGRLVVERFVARGERVVAVDTDPLKLEGLVARGVFGSADSAAVLLDAGVADAKLVVTATQIEDTNALLTYRCTRISIPIGVHALDSTVADELLEMGIDYLMASKVDGIRLVEEELHKLGVLG